MCVEFAFKTAFELRQKDPDIADASLIQKTTEYTFEQFKAYKNLLRDIIPSLRNHKNDDMEGYKKSITAMFYMINEENIWESDLMGRMNFLNLINQFVDTN